MRKSCVVEQNEFSMKFPQCDQQKEEQGMYPFLSSEHLFSFLDCLADSHQFATAFNLNDVQVRLPLFVLTFKVFGFLFIDLLLKAEFVLFRGTFYDLLDSKIK